jgi:hypothetical protein
LTRGKYPALGKNARAKSDLNRGSKKEFKHFPVATKLRSVYDVKKRFPIEMNCPA